MLIPPTLIGLIQECRYTVPRKTGPECCEAPKIYIEGCGCLEKCPAGTYRNPLGCDCLPIPEVLFPDQEFPLPISGPLPTEGPARWSTNQLWQVFVRGVVGFNCDFECAGRPYCVTIGELSAEATATIAMLGKTFITQTDGRFNNYCGPVCNVTWFVWNRGSNSDNPLANQMVQFFNDNVPGLGNYYGRRGTTTISYQPMTPPGFTGIKPCSVDDPPPWRLYRVKIKLEPRPLPIWFETFLPEPTRTIIMPLPSPVVAVNEDGLFLELENGDKVGPLGYTLSERVFYKYELEEVEEI